MLLAATAIMFAALTAIDSAYLEWNLTDPESAVAATLLHEFEWLFVRIAPLVFVGACIGAAVLRPRA